MFLHSIRRNRGRGTSQADKALSIFADFAWHSTGELRRRVGLFFGVAIWILRGEGFQIEKRRHPFKRFHWQYRLSSDTGESQPTVIVRPRHRKE